MNNIYSMAGLQENVLVEVIRRVDTHTVQVKVLEKGNLMGCKFLSHIDKLTPVKQQ